MGDRPTGCGQQKEEEVDKQAEIAKLQAQVKELEELCDFAVLHAKQDPRPLRPSHGVSLQASGRLRGVVHDLSSEISVLEKRQLELKVETERFVHQNLLRNVTLEK